MAGGTHGPGHGAARRRRPVSRFRAGARYGAPGAANQLRLSAESGISQRHISFLESGRSQPSRELILRLGNALDISLRQRNAMLLAAGFAPQDSANAR